MTTINPLAAALAALFDQSLQAAVTSSRELDENEVRDLVGRATAPTVDRLDGRIDSQAQTITELLDRVTALEARLAALEAAPAGLQRFADGRPITAESIREIAEAAAEAALDEHCEGYDHDGYDAHVNDDDKHFDGDVGEAVREALDGQSFTISL